MAERRVGQEFIKHEFDEAIAIQQSIVEAERGLSKSHPLKEAKQALKSMLREDERQLTQLQRLGKPFGASGEMEEVAGGMVKLMELTLEHASGEVESETYEAHAVLLSLKRKQQDSAASVLKIARALKNPELRDAAAEMQKANKKASDELAKSLSDFAVLIAKQAA